MNTPDRVNEQESITAFVDKSEEQESEERQEKIKETVEEKEYVKPKPLTVTMSASAKRVGNKVYFTIKTNLPDGMHVMFSLENGIYHAQSKGIVKDGTVTLEGFTSRGKPLLGRYTLEVSTPVATAQPDEVIEILGDGCVMLEGRLVEISSTGQSKVVEAYFDFDF